jgi:hypothetical protein
MEVIQLLMPYNQIHPVAVYIVFVYVMATYGLLIQLMLHSAYVSSGLGKQHQSSYGVIEMIH